MNASPRAGSVLASALPFVCVASMIASVAVWGTVPVQNAHFGDDQEYLTMATSLIRHGSADFAPGDDTEMLRALPRKWRKTLGKKFGPGRPPYAYYESKDHRFYGWHFFTYPALVAPFRALLNGEPVAFRAHQFTNLIVFCVALLSLLQLRSRPVLFWALAPLAFFTPVLWFLTYAHTESFVFSLGLISLTCLLAHRPLGAILFSSIAATQYQPLAPLSVFLYAEWLWQHRRRLSRGGQANRALLAACAGLCVTAIIIIPSVFYYVHFGVPNLIVREGLASLRFVSAAKFGWMLADPNQGMLFYVPGVCLLLAAAAVWTSKHAARERSYWGVGLFGCVLFMMLASTCQRNWNHPTFGVSRYVLYSVAPALLFIGRELARSKLSKAQVGLVVVAIALQVCAQFEYGFFEYKGRDAAHHSDAALYVLEHWPALYSPPPEIFCERTVGTCMSDGTGEPLPQFLPAIWQDSTGRARKILTEDCDPEKVLRARTWSADEERRIRASLRDCRGAHLVYINL